MNLRSNYDTILDQDPERNEDPDDFHPRNPMVVDGHQEELAAAKIGIHAPFLQLPTVPMPSLPPPPPPPSSSFETLPNSTTLTFHSMPMPEMGSYSTDYYENEKIRSAIGPTSQQEDTARNSTNNNINKNNKKKKAMSKKKNRTTAEEKHEQHRNFCIDVPFIFRSFAKPNKNIYQSQYESVMKSDGTFSSSHNGRAVEEDYGEDSVYSSNVFYRNPNRGISNSSHGDGTTIPELVVRMKIFNLSFCLVGIMLESYTLLGNALTLRPARVVLGAYLIFFSLMLIAFDLHLPFLTTFIRTNFGFLYSTYGRSGLLWLMGILSMGQHSWTMFLVGTSMIFLAIYTIYIRCKFPAFEQAFAQEGVDTNDRSAKNNLLSYARKKVTKYAWSSIQGYNDERTGLMSSNNRYY